MNEQLLNILNEDEAPKEETLIAYLEGTLSEQDKADLEMQLNTDPILREALEGLKQVATPQRILHISSQLNQQLHKRLKQSHQKQKKWQAPQYITILAVCMILALLLISFLLIYRLQKS